MSTIEETLVLIKPDGVARSLSGEILRRIVAGRVTDPRAAAAARGLGGGTHGCFENVR